MRFKNITVLLLAVSFIYLSASFSNSNNISGNMGSENDSILNKELHVKYKGAKKLYNITKTEKEWKEILTDAEFRILREKGTERASTGKYYHHDETGIYYCAACGNELFSSNEKYDSGSGWPSFYAPKSKNDINEITDKSFAMIRTEVVCSRCGSHLGHVFNDGPNPTGLRYCVNSASLKFKKSTSDKK